MGLKKVMWRSRWPLTSSGAKGCAGGVSRVKISGVTEVAVRCITTRPGLPAVPAGSIELWHMRAQMGKSPFQVSINQDAHYIAWAMAHLGAAL